MYCKDLNSDLRLRLTNDDFQFLASTSQKRQITMSQLIRDIIGTYRRAYTLSSAMESCYADLMEEMSHGDTKTNIYNIV